MAKRRLLKNEDGKAFKLLTEEEQRALADKYWIPNLNEVYATIIDISINDKGRVGNEARKLLLDRIMGKVVEPKKEEGMSITINLRDIDRPEIQIENPKGESISDRSLEDS